MRIGFDTGGTFTDVVFTDSAGNVSARKLLSVHATLGDRIRDIVEEKAGEEVDLAYVHGTTIGSNAVIEGKTAKFGLLATRGFRDIIELRGERRPAIYDVNWDRLPPLTRRALRLEISERILADGTVEQAVDREEVERAVRTLVARGAEAIAICLFNSYVSHAHEQQVLEIVRALAPNLPVCTSEAFSEIGEYERTSTVSTNASLLPILETYLSRLEHQLGVNRGGLLIMQSNGGLMSSVAARAQPVRMLESGPAAGVLAVAHIAGEIGLEDVLSFDMGGTTAKAALVLKGRPVEKTSSEVGGGATLATRLFGGGGHVVRVPTFDIVEVGAGGGSLAWVDAGGVLHVGPEGAGADPGPVCYSRGGTQPTVTDANVVLGYMNPLSIADGTVPIDREAAAAAIADKIARPLDIDLLEGALGILRVADSTMIRALRAVTIERGVDPRGVTLMGFGGSGPLHAARLAENMGIDRVYIPPFPGVLSAFGLLLADYRQDAVHSFMQPISEVSAEELEAAYQQLEEAVVTMLAGGAARDVYIEREVELQYRGEASSLTFARPDAGADDLHQRLSEEFSTRYAVEYGYARDETPLLVAARIRATSASAGAPVSELALRTAPREGLGSAQRDAYFGHASGMIATPIISRADLKTARAGPLIVEEPNTSVLIPPGWQGVCDQHMGISLSFIGGAGGQA